MTERAKPAAKPEAQTRSGRPIAKLYEPEGGAPESIGPPGESPFVRGIHASMYLGKPWTMRQYAGFGSAAESNQRYKFLLASGQTGGAARSAVDAGRQNGIIESASGFLVAANDGGPAIVVVGKRRQNCLPLREMPLRSLTASRSKSRNPLAVQVAYAPRVHAAGGFSRAKPSILRWGEWDRERRRC